MLQQKLFAAPWLRLGDIQHGIKTSTPNLKHVILPFQKQNAKESLNPSSRETNHSLFQSPPRRSSQHPSSSFKIQNGFTPPKPPLVHHPPRIRHDNPRTLPPLQKSPHEPSSRPYAPTRHRERRDRSRVPIHSLHACGRESMAARQRTSPNNPRAASGAQDDVWGVDERREEEFEGIGDL